MPGQPAGPRGILQWRTCELRPQAVAERGRARKPVHRALIHDDSRTRRRGKLLHLTLKHPRSRTGLARLNQLAEVLVYLPLSTPVMRRAAELWAQARASGLPTAGEAELDGDIILAAQAQNADGTEVTMNPRHLGRFVPVADWHGCFPDARRRAAGHAVRADL